METLRSAPKAKINWQNADRLSKYIRTHILHTAVVYHLFLCWVLPQTAQEVANFSAIYQTVPTVPEIKQIENLSAFCNENDDKECNNCKL